MNDWCMEIEEAIAEFLTVAALARDPISRSEIEVECCAAPHTPPGDLPASKVAVYGFWHDGAWLKIGKVGPNSHNRYRYQHYNAGSARSTLAGSLMGDPKMAAIVGSDRTSVGEWIKTSTCRVNILLPAKRQSALLSLLEAFLHLRFRPWYERQQV